MNKKGMHLRLGTSGILLLFASWFAAYFVYNYAKSSGVSWLAFLAKWYLFVTIGFFVIIIGILVLVILIAIILISLALLSRRETSRRRFKVGKDMKKRNYDNNVIDANYKMKE